MAVSDATILRYEKKIASEIIKIFRNNEQAIISKLFSDMSAAGTFPLNHIDVNQFAADFYNNYLALSNKITPIAFNIVNNYIKIETRNYIANIWINTIKESNSFIQRNLFYVDAINSSYDSTKVSVVGGKKWKPAIGLYTNNKPNLTYIIEFSEATDNFFSSIRLACIPNGQLKSLYKGTRIISPQNTGSPSSVYFDFNQIIKKDANKSWRYCILYSRVNHFNSLKEIQEVEAIEEKENKYLQKYYHFLKYSEEEMLSGFKTKEKIKKDWIGYYNTSISDFAVGAERIVYALFNGKGIGQPNSCPVGSDLFFEVDDAYIHIDLKTVQLDNIGDYNTNIFVGLNQNSYKGNMIVEPKKGGQQELRLYEPSLPNYYNKGINGAEKVCLSYFVTILYDKATLDIYLISLICMPNGILEKVYGSMALQAGKNPEKTRYCFSESDSFISDNTQKRIKCIMRDDTKITSDPKINSKLTYYLSLDV